MISSAKKLTLVLFLVVLPVAVTGQQISQREQLDQLLANLQQNPSDQSLREQVIRFATAMLPQPAVPEEARQDYIEGMTLHQDAKSPSDEKAAVDSYRKGIALAPWWGDLYLGMGVSQELSGDLQGAIDSLHDYLLSSPPPDKARSAQDHIYMLDAKLKEANATQHAATDAVESRHKLSGLWKCQLGCQGYAPVSSDGTDFHVNLGGFQFDGHFESGAVTGLVTIPSQTAGETGCSLPLQTHQMTAYVENNGQTIRLQYEATLFNYRWHKAPDAVLGWLSPHPVCDSVTEGATSPQQAELVGGPKKPHLGLQVRTLVQTDATANQEAWWKAVFNDGLRKCERQRKSDSAGVVVISVEPNSPAAAAGFKPGDVINIQKSGGLFCTGQDFANYVDGIYPDSPYTLQVYSGSKKPLIYSVKNEPAPAF